MFLIVSYLFLSDEIRTFNLRSVFLKKNSFNQKREREIEIFYRTVTKSFCKRSSMSLEDKLNKRKWLNPI